jgi:hypothetical protein
MKSLAILLIAVLATGICGAEVRPIDQVFHDGNQVRAAAKKLNLEMLQVYGGSSDYGDDSYMIQRSYKVGDPDGSNENDLLTEIRAQLEKDISDRGWQVDAFPMPKRNKEDDFVRITLTYSAEERIGTVILKSVKVDGGWLLFIDLLEQTKRAQVQERSATE